MASTNEITTTVLMIKKLMVPKVNIEYFLV